MAASLQIEKDYSAGVGIYLRYVWPMKAHYQVPSLISFCLILRHFQGLLTCLFSNFSSLVSYHAPVVDLKSSFLKWGWHHMVDEYHACKCSISSGQQPSHTDLSLRHSSRCFHHHGWLIISKCATNTSHRVSLSGCVVSLKSIHALLHLMILIWAPVANVSSPKQTDARLCGLEGCILPLHTKPPST